MRVLSCKFLGRVVNSALPQQIISQRSLSRTAAVMVKVGDSLPSVDLFEDSPANKINTGDLVNGKKVIIFGVPGAFTPGCSKTHLPGYVSSADELKSKQGVDEIVCVSVNDPFVMSAWGKEHGATGKVRLLADPAGGFTKALDVTIDLPPLGGVRSKRYSLVVENGKVTELNVEPDGTGLSCSLANNIGKK
ncbi:peroxiredoxin-5, mitochondrial [Drosophila subpulchrella]|uniref:peroxiredoxin-5, mitochondrial n=1 Tax=Drosophila subpulchrella TaxID=1486046 RepID=UPI0018A17D19|nr:peroxiredoxin-5, mitochondrial [Drosophila subpulchrella]